VTQPPPGSIVPRWLYEIVKKGLSPRAEDRYPSMAALLDALSKDPAQRRNKILAGAGAAAVALGVIGFVTWSSVQASRGCRKEGEQVAEVWSPRARAAGEKAFLATGKPWAQAAWEHARNTIDRHAGEWTRARVDSCEATHVRGEQNKHQHELRVACLEQEKDELKTLTATFAEANLTVVNQAADAVARLTPVSACANLQALELRARSMPQDIGRWKALHRDVADGRLKVAAGQMSAARVTIDAAVAAADQLGEPGLVADAFEALAELEKAAGKFTESRAAYQRAVQAALIAGDDASAARHLAALVSMVGWRLEKPAEGLMLGGLARGLLARAGGDPVLGARIDEGEGDAQWQAGNRPASLVSYKKAHDALLEAQGEKSLDVARLKSSIGWVEFEQGKFTEARAKLSESRAIRESMLGPDHPVLAETWNELGNLAQLAGEYDEAVRCFLRALEIRQATLDADASPFTRMLLNVADAYADGGKAKESWSYVVRAKANLAKMPTVAPTWSTQALRVEARVVAAQGKLPEALKLAEEAVRVSKTQLGAAHPETAVALRAQALVMMEAGKSKDALAVLDEYLQVVAKLGPNEGADEPMGHVYAARALIKLKQPAEAVLRIEKALKLLAGMTGHKPLKAEAQLTLADALWTVGEEKPRARELGAAAQALFESVDRLDDAQRAKAWVEAHR
jgi:eukaryotic-like serine/threonine-protein kinase